MSASIFTQAEILESIESAKESLAGFKEMLKWRQKYDTGEGRGIRIMDAKQDIFDADLTVKNWESKLTK